ncbi:response regulator [uncultured Brevundimonas sp.]|uniref:response regulator n=1 Tax=uncultured Brevundimonas sp. TaxID=213418 RepID=UPI0030EF4FDF
MASSRIDLRKSKVLLVDDNPQSLELLSQILTGFRVRQITPCRSASEAKPMLALERFDLILIDFDMEEEDGVALVRHIRSQDKEPNYTTPIVVMHGYTPHHMVTKVRDAGANLVVKKPLAPGILLKRIEWVARSHRDFVSAPNFTGPDRRFKAGVGSEQGEERRADALALVSDPDRALSQDDISALFG